MPTSVTQYNLLISCPSDVRDEIDIIKQTVQRFNEQFSEKFKIVFVVKHWKQDAYPEAGGNPQTLLNRQIVDSCDVAVAIFWNRFGTPTEKYQSGTEEEIAIMLEANKQVFMYFSEIPTNNVIDNKEIDKIKAYREEYSKNGLYDTYSTIKQFEELFYNHLISYAKDKQRDFEVSQKRQPVFKLVGIDEQDNLSDVAKIQQFKPKGKYSVEERIDEIKQLCNEINGIDVHSTDNEYKRKICKNALANSILMGCSNQVINIEEESKNIINIVVSALRIELGKAFFDLGTLIKQTELPLMTSKIIGTEDEREKYDKLCELTKLSKFFIQYGFVWTKFAEMKCLKLALQNCGTAIDRDIEVKLTIPKSALITVEKFPQFDNEQMRYLLHDCEMDELFGISANVQYNDFYSSQEKIGNISPYVDASVFNFPYREERNYTEPFFNKLKNIFDYSVYEAGEDYILKLNFDYLKHNTTVAFPSVIFLRNEIDTLSYQITSQNNEDVINGEIEIVAE